VAACGECLKSLTARGGFDELRTRVGVTGKGACALGFYSPCMEILPQEELWIEGSLLRRFGCPADSGKEMSPTGWAHKEVTRVGRGSQEEADISAPPVKTEGDNTAEWVGV
jgi:hypothetical protein